MIYMLQGSHFYLVANITNALGIDVMAVPITTIKKFATGSGKADKKGMLSAMPEDVLNEFRKYYVPSRGLGDLVDAYWLGKYALENKKGARDDAKKA